MKDLFIHSFIHLKFLSSLNKCLAGKERSINSMFFNCILLCNIESQVKYNNSNNKVYAII